MDWNEFTRISAREFMCQTIRKGDYWNEHSEANVAERSVRWAVALTEELKKLEKEEKKETE